MARFAKKNDCAAASWSLCFHALINSCLMWKSLLDVQERHILDSEARSDVLQLKDQLSFTDTSRVRTTSHIMRMSLLFKNKKETMLATTRGSMKWRKGKGEREREQERERERKREREIEIERIDEREI